MSAGCDCAQPTVSVQGAGGAFACSNGTLILALTAGLDSRLRGNDEIPS